MTSARLQLRRLGMTAFSAVLCSAAGAGTAPAAGPAPYTISPMPAGSATAPSDGLTITTTVTDADDTSGKLDIAAVRHRITRSDARHVSLSYRLTTYDAFRLRRLDERHRNFVLELNRDAERGSERNVRISYLDGFGPLAEVISNATRQVIATVEVIRIDSHTVAIRGGRRVIGARSYFWTSNFHVAGHGRCGWRAGYPITCQDTVPGNGWIRLDTPAWPRPRHPAGAGPPSPIGGGY